MSRSREAIFGPVLCILPFRDDDEGIEIANDTVYDLSSYISGRDPERMRPITERLRAGMVHINGANLEFRRDLRWRGEPSSDVNWTDRLAQRLREVTTFPRIRDGHPARQSP